VLEIFIKDLLIKITYRDSPKHLNLSTNKGEITMGTSLPPKQDFRVMTDVKCKKCGKMLKFNLIRKKPHASTCYKCHQEDK